MMSSLKSKLGFTMVELMVAITIMGIIAATFSWNFSSGAKDKKADDAAMGFYLAVKGLRAQAIAEDVPYFVSLDIAGNDFTVYKDIANDQDPANAEATTIGKDFFGTDMELLEFDYSQSNFSGTFDTNTAFNLSSTIQGSWSINNMITIDNDALGTINSGCIFLNNTLVNNSGYAMVREPQQNVLKLYKWDGKKWYEM